MWMTHPTALFMTTNLPLVGWTNRVAGAALAAAIHGGIRCIPIIGIAYLGRCPVALDYGKLNVPVNVYNTRLGTSIAHLGYASLATSVPIRAPSATRWMLPGTLMSKTTMGRLFSMQKAMAVRSMTFKRRSMASA